MAAAWTPPELSAAGPDGQPTQGSAFWLQHWGHRQCNLSPGCRSGGSTGMQAQVCTLVHTYIHFLLCALLQLQTSLEVGGGKA